MATSPASKSDLRRLLRAAAEIPPASLRAEASASMVRHCLGRPEWSACRGLLAFSPLPDEPDIRPLLQEALRGGKLLSLPRFSRESGAYVPVTVQDLARDLVTGRYGVLEPAPGCPETTINHLDLALIPGVGFSFAGGRLGRGGGYYDRLLERFSGIRCGVAFEWQLAVEIPMERHDVAMDSVLTPDGWRVVPPRGAVSPE